VLLAREDVIDVESIGPLLPDEESNATSSEDAGAELDAVVCRWLTSQQPPSGAIYDAAMAAFERPLFAQVLRETGGNQLRAAQALGINRNTLRKRLGELSLDPEHFARRI
jgi:two-component system nitrogen regulation response regulator GlnG